MILRTIREITKVIIGNGLSQSLLLIGEIALAVILSPSEFGFFALCFALLLLISNICLLGTNFGIINYLAILQEGGDKRDLGRMIMWCLAFVCNIDIHGSITMIPV